MNITKLAREVSENHNRVSRLAEILVAEIEFQNRPILTKQERRDLLKRFATIQGVLDNITTILEGRKI